MAKTYTLRWSKTERTFVLQRPSKDAVKFGNCVPLEIIRREAAKIAKAEKATLVLRDE